MASLPHTDFHGTSFPFSLESAASFILDLLYINFPLPSSPITRRIVAKQYRNQEICERYAAGESLAELAENYGSLSSGYTRSFAVAHRDLSTVNPLSIYGYTRNLNEALNAVRAQRGLTGTTFPERQTGEKTQPRNRERRKSPQNHSPELDIFRDMQRENRVHDANGDGSDA